MMHTTPCTFPDCKCHPGYCERLKPSSVYIDGKRYDHPDQTLRYVLDTLRTIQDELTEIKRNLPCFCDKFPFCNLCEKKRQKADCRHQWETSSTGTVWAVYECKNCGTRKTVT